MGITGNRQACCRLQGYCYRAAEGRSCGMKNLSPLSLLRSLYVSNGPNFLNCENTAEPTVSRWGLGPAIASVVRAIPTVWIYLFPSSR